jgi:hypothetical protein
MMRAMVERGYLEPVDETAEADAGEVRYAITVEGGAFLETLGVIVPPSRRPVRYHADSTEEGLHLSGALGCSHLLTVSPESFGICRSNRHTGPARRPADIP